MQHSWYKFPDPSNLYLPSFNTVSISWWVMTGKDIEQKDTCMNTYFCYIIWSSIIMAILIIMTMLIVYVKKTSDYILVHSSCLYLLGCPELPLCHHGHSNNHVNAECACKETVTVLLWVPTVYTSSAIQTT